MDLPLLSALTGWPVRHRSREPNQPETAPEADALLVAPATFNTIKVVAGITDTVAAARTAPDFGT